MSQRLLEPRTVLSRAVVASACIHILIGSGLFVWLVIFPKQSPVSRTELDTRIQVVSLGFDDFKSVAISPATSNVVNGDPAPAIAQPPLARSIPETLSPGMISIIQGRQNSSTTQATSAVSEDSNVQHAHAVSGTPSQPLHGGMKPGQTVVYLLDCSGSMGEFGKLSRAESALLATLRGQPNGVRIQVICYNSKAWQLFPNGFVAIAADRERAETLFAQLEAKGRSNHAAAVRLAVELRPDAVVWLTDGDDLAISRYKPLVQSTGKSIPVYRAAVLPDVVKPPQKLQ